jgi:stress-induced-phosphoprotein 1
MSKNSEALALKAQGNEFFKAKSYENAIEKYSEAIAVDGSDVTFFSNRSACYFALEMFQEAADDGRQCVIIDKNFVKGYFRAASAHQKMENYDLALDFVKRGLGVESTNKDLKGMAKTIEESLRQVKLRNAIDQANNQLGQNDIYGAYKTVEGAMKIAPDDPQIKQLYSEVKPKYDAKEKSRISSLTGTERLKEEGDALFKKSQFETAINKYTEALNAASSQSSEIALKIYGNRAACYKQLSDFDNTINDCTSVLEYREEDVKALMRRAQAYEAMERYRSALQDVRQVLALGLEKAGKASYDLANGMQHRLNRVIAQLKAM